MRKGTADMPKRTQPARHSGSSSITRESLDAHPLVLTPAEFGVLHALALEMEAEGRVNWTFRRLEPQRQAELVDVDCTAPITPGHLERANSLLPDGVEITDARALLPGAPTLGRLVDRVRYRVSAVPEGPPWPDGPGGLDPELQAAVHEWHLEDDGSLRLELNARQDAGPTPSLKKVLTGLGLAEAEAARVRASREALVLRPRGAGAAVESEAVEATLP